MKAILLCGSLALAAGAAVADAERGAKLHEESCMKCHGTEVYTRDDRFIDSRDALVAQVQRCQMNVGAQWNELQVEDVAQYLNRAYYKFP
jgi:hypothetical protein